MKTNDAARGRWYGILRQFGIEEQYLRNRHGPCPVCSGKDRFRWDDRGGDGTFFCSSCGAGSGMDLVMAYTGLDFATAAKQIDGMVNNIERAPEKPAGPDPRVRLRKLAQSLVPMDGINPVRLYLKSRGLSPGQATQYAPAVPYYEDGQYQGSYPAMVHIFRAPDGAPLTYHVTYLTEGGQKAPVRAPKKVMPGVGPLSGGAIQLSGSSDVLGIAEGIETALAAGDRYDIPVWAAYSATLLEQWQPPAEAKHIWIFADNDHSYTGQAAAYALAKRLTREGYGVNVAITREMGTDFADEAGHGK